MASPSSSTYRHPTNLPSRYPIRVAIPPPVTDDCSHDITAKEISDGAVKRWIDISIDAKAFQPQNPMCAHLQANYKCVTGKCFLAFLWEKCPVAKEEHEGRCSRRYVGEKQGSFGIQDGIFGIQDGIMRENGMSVYCVEGIEGVNIAVPDKWDKERVRKWTSNSEGVLVRENDGGGNVECA